MNGDISPGVPETFRNNRPGKSYPVLLAVSFGIFLSGIPVGLNPAERFGGKNPVTRVNSTSIPNGEILFAAHNSSDPDADLNLFVINSDGSELEALTTEGGYETPDIESIPGGGWRVAYGSFGIYVFDSETEQTVKISDMEGATRADFVADASSVVFQGGGQLDGE